MSRSVARRVVRFFPHPTKADVPVRGNAMPDKPQLDLLTERELEFVQSLAVSYAEKEMVAQLGIAHSTHHKDRRI